MGKNSDGTGSNPRIGRNLAAALRALVFDGLSVQDAAKAAGMTDNGLYAALRKPHVRAARDALRGALRDSDRDRNYYVLKDLRDHATSEYVRADMAKHLGAIYGDRVKTDGPQAGGGGIMLQIAFKHVSSGQIGASAVQPPTIEAQAVEVQSLPAGERYMADVAGATDGGRGS